MTSLLDESIEKLTVLKIYACDHELGQTKTQKDITNSLTSLLSFRLPVEMNDAKVEDVLEQLKEAVDNLETALHTVLPVHEFFDVNWRPRGKTEDELRLNEKLNELCNVVSQVNQVVDPMYFMVFSNQDKASKTNLLKKSEERKPILEKDHEKDHEKEKEVLHDSMGCSISPGSSEASAEPVDIGPSTLKQEHSDSSEDDDELASIFSSRSTAYASSISSLASDGISGLQDALEELASLFLNEFYRLLDVALRRRNAEANFASKFRSLLIVYGKELRQEAGNGGEEAAAKLIQVRARYIASRIQTKWTEESGRSHQAGPARDHSGERKVARRGRLETLLKDTTQPGHSQLAQPNLIHPESFQILSTEDVEQDDFEDDYQSDTSSINGEADNNPLISEASLIALTEFMISSAAFDRLRNAFWRMVYPNPLHGIRELLSTAFNEISGPDTAHLKISLPIQSYFATELGYDPGIKKEDHVWKRVLTITGRASQAYADTAEAYVRWKWPNAKIKVLELVGTLLKAKPDGDQPLSLHTEGCSLSLPRYKSESMTGTGDIYARVTGTVRDIVETAEQFAWLSASFRKPKEGQLSYSDISFKRTGRRRFVIGRLELEEVQPRQSACWLPIFVNGIIARGFPIPPRHNNEKGIELPFQVMSNLAKVMYSQSHSGGFYLKGFSSILYPTAIPSDGKSVQWHISLPSGLKDYVLPGTVPPSEGDDAWVKTDNIENLTCAQRTFLGYTRAIEAHLGTDSAVAQESFRATRASGAYDEDPATAIEVNKIETGTSGFGIWSLSASAEIIYPKGLYHTAETGWYIDMLDITKSRPLIIYDHSESKRAWLVPTLSAVLHMAHIWARDKQLLGQIPVAKVGWDAGEAAYLAIKESSKNELRDPLEADRKYLVRDLIGRLLICLEKLLEVEAKARSEPRRTVSLETSTKLYGWDLLGIAQGDGNVWRQQLEIDQEWRLLGRDLAVLFCQNIGELVKPASNVRLCPTANAALARQDRLIAPVKCLRWLSDKRGKPANSSCLRLGNKVFWVSPGMSLFDDCAECLLSSPRGVDRCVKQAQQILRSDCPDQKSVTPPIEGVVAFGTRKLQKPRLPASSKSSVLSQSLSSETQATSVSPTDSSTSPLPVLDDIDEAKTHFKRKLKKRRPFNLLSWKS